MTDKQVWLYPTDKHTTYILLFILLKLLNMHLVYLAMKLVSRFKVIFNNTCSVTQSQIVSLDRWKESFNAALVMMPNGQYLITVHSNHMGYTILMSSAQMVILRNVCLSLFVAWSRSHLKINLCIWLWRTWFVTQPFFNLYFTFEQIAWADLSMSRHAAEFSTQFNWLKRKMINLRIALA